eukprot:TRINITY_DN42208_c0_g1_i1.p1 TRINITY_DN42208_c0_g1~~TRINITY_DN42208_c0_g1_i1.p1  ORF type:complete len:1725 (-),score=269.31 TRINITY_DN42208_c0_g1_i1:214-4689(-)
MILFERGAYNELWQPQGGSTATVLAHTSVYWGASALGQFSIALAFGGTCVWTEASEPNDLRQCIAKERVNVLGVVPDHLDLLAPTSPAEEVPTVQVVFTWGERLPRRTAERWRGSSGAKLRELLIATEYWLSLWADPLSDGALRFVSGTQLLVLTDDGRDASTGELGELCISGPMVMAGYHGAAASSSAGGLATDETFYIEPGSGRRFFRTRDLVRRVPGGVVYKGRADMMVKDKGKWVDMLAVEDGLAQVPGIGAVKLLPDPAQEHFHAFVSFDGLVAPGKVADAARTALPPKTQLWIVPELPRHPVTRKVDANRLMRVINRSPQSWPLEALDKALAPALSGPSVALSRARLNSALWSQISWALAALGSCWVLADRGTIVRQLTFAAAARVGALLVLRRGRGRGRGPDDHAEEAERASAQLAFDRDSALCTAAWVASALLVGGVPDFGRIARGSISVTSFTYGWLALTYADDMRFTSRIAASVMAVVDVMPFWKWGAFILFSLGQHVPGHVGTLSFAVLLSASFVGASLALARRRLFAWPLVFWGLGIGNQLRIDCSHWLCLAKWVGHASWQACKLRDAVSSILFKRISLSHVFRPATQASDVPKTDSPRVDEVVENFTACARCSSPCNTRWPALDEKRSLICDACADEHVTHEELNAGHWLATRMQEDSANSTSVHRDNDCSSVGGGVVSDGCNSEGYCVATTRPHETPAADVPAAKRRRTETSSDENDVAEGGREPAPEWSSEERQWQMQRLEMWWWRRCTSTDVQVSKPFGGDDAALPSGSSQAGTVKALTPEERLLCTMVEEVEPLLRPARLNTVLLGLDSLRVARLANAIGVRLGRALTAVTIRKASTVAELVDLVASAESISSSSTGEDSQGNANVALHNGSSPSEFAVWYSPGQYSPMGNWVLRTEEQVDHAALILATQGLAERHAALRTEAADPLRYLSFVYDAATMFSLFGPILETSGKMSSRLLRRAFSWGLTHAWPRVRCLTREQMYGKRYPGTAAPLEMVQCTNGQTEFERVLKQKRNTLVPPGGVTVYELVCHLCDVWTYERWHGRFVILRPQGIPAVRVGSSQLVYVDMSSMEWGPLVGPEDDRWLVPPYGFPAIFYVPLSTGAKLWLRVEKGDELHLHYCEPPDSTGQQEEGDGCRTTHHLTAYRAAPRRGRETHKATVVTFLGVSMFHSHADGNCYLPLVQDLLTFYGAARAGGSAWPPRLPALGNPFAELQRRLMDTFHCRPSPMRASLRGGIWKYKGRGYGHSIGLRKDAMMALAKASLHYRVPLDVTLFSLVSCAMARTEEVDILEYTLYTPMRDGASEAMSVGLFSDWRDISISLDFKLSTVLGTILQTAYKVQNRQWTVYNALRKPERCVVNILPLDFERRAGFLNLGENMWCGGDQLGRREERGQELSWCHQPASFVIEQQDEVTWWILICGGQVERPPSWTRRFIHSFNDAVAALFAEPLASVHTPLPSDEDLLWAYREEAAAEGYI